MPENMSISVNGQSQVPPGFRFHPTEEELLQYYLRKKVSYEKIDLDVIRDVDLNKLEPWEIQERCKIGTTPQNDWYFFSHKDKKYPTGTRTNRATAAGFWKATGRDKVIHSNGRRIGMRKTLVFYKGRAPHGQKSDWIMHEYRLDDICSSDTNIVGEAAGETSQEEGWVVCRIFKKKNHHKTLESPMSSSPLAGEPRGLVASSSEEGSLEQILRYMGRACEREDEGTKAARMVARPADGSYLQVGRFMKLPSLESPNSAGATQACYQPPTHAELMADATNQGSEYHVDAGLANWAALDRLVASQLNGQTTGLTDPSMGFCAPGGDDDLPLRPSPSGRPFQDFATEMELWNFSRSSPLPSSDPLCHASNAPA